MRSEALFGLILHIFVNNGGKIACLLRLYQLKTIYSS